MATKGNMNSELRIRFTGRVDAKKKDIFMAITHIPANVDLSDAVMFFFPDEDEETGKFGGDLVIRRYEPGVGRGPRQDDEPPVIEEEDQS